MIISNFIPEIGYTDLLACYEIDSDLSKAIDKNILLYLGYYGCN